MKNWYASKTIWFNVLAVGVFVAVPFLASAGYTGELPEGGRELAFLITGVVNLALRYFATSTSLRGDGSNNTPIVG